MLNTIILSCYKILQVFYLAGIMDMKNCLAHGLEVPLTYNNEKPYLIPAPPNLKASISVLLKEGLSKLKHQ